MGIRRLRCVEYFNKMFDERFSEAENAVATFHTDDPEPFLILLQFLNSNELAELAFSRLRLHRAADLD